MAFACNALYERIVFQNDISKEPSCIISKNIAIYIRESIDS